MTAAPGEQDIFQNQGDAGVLPSVLITQSKKRQGGLQFALCTGWPGCNKCAGLIFLLTPQHFAPIFATFLQGSRLSGWHSFARILSLKYIFMILKMHCLLHLQFQKHSFSSIFTPHLVLSRLSTTKICSPLEPKLTCKKCGMGKLFVFTMSKVDFKQIFYFSSSDCWRVTKKMIKSVKNLQKLSCILRRKNNKN